MPGEAKGGLTTDWTAYLAAGIVHSRLVSSPTTFSDSALSPTHMAAIHFISASANKSGCVKQLQLDKIRDYFSSVADTDPDPH
jgi:hypothetical protein